MRRLTAAVLAGVATAGLFVATASTPSFAASPFQGHGSIDEAYVVDAPPGEHLTLLNGSGSKVGTGVVDSLGGLIIRNLTPGGGFRFEETSRKHRETASFSVLSTNSTPPPSFYSSQHLHAGLNYVRMRDGITIAATVRLPPGKTLADGPFPTVIEYSGYAMAAPHSLIDALEGKAPPATRCSPTPPPWSAASSPRCSASPPSASRCAARGARVGPSTSSGCPRTTTATT